MTFYLGVFPHRPTCHRWRDRGGVNHRVVRISHGGISLDGVNGATACWRFLFTSWTSWTDNFISVNAICQFILLRQCRWNDGLVTCLTCLAGV